MVCIIDDRDDVWNFAPNLIQVRPYKYFEGTGDINSAGLPTNPNAEAKSQGKFQAKSADVKGDDASETSKDDGKVDCKEGKEIDPTTDTKVDSANELKDDSKVDLANESNSKDDSKVDPKDESMSDVNVELSATKERKDADAEDANTDSKNTEDAETVHDSSKDENPSVKEQTNESSKESTKTDAAANKDKLEEGEIDCAPKEPSDKNKDLLPGDKKEKSAEGDSSKSSEDKEDCSDDYLLYLQDILIRIHTAYFKMHDQSSSDSKLKADLTEIVPSLRTSVLSGVHIVFSGVFPTNMPPEQSRAWKTAVALGAQVSGKIIPRDKAGGGPTNATTHLIAAKIGTNKVGFM